MENQEDDWQSLLGDSPGILSTFTEDRQGKTIVGTALDLLIIEFRKPSPVTLANPELRHWSQFLPMTGALLKKGS